MKSFSLSLVQLRPEPGRVDDNIGKHVDFIRAAAREGSALVVFPECSLTGYAAEGAGALALSGDSEGIRALEHECYVNQIAVCFGYLERRGEELQIAQELFSAGERIVYRKTHLGSREEGVFRTGDEFPMLTAPVSAGMQLCWESHIPEISALYRGRGAELLLMPYASGMSGEKCRENWAVHLPARASDNGAWAAACNLLFPQGRAAGGGLALYDPKGRLAAGYFGTEEHMLTCALSGPLPREIPAGDMHAISYFDKTRRELFR